MLDDKEKDYFEGHVERLTPRRLIVLPWLLWVAFIGLAIGCVLYSGKAVPASSLPRAQNQVECQVISDVIWAARALDKNDIPPAAAMRILADFYTATPIEDRLNVYIPAAMKHAARNKNVAPHELGRMAFIACDEARGNLTAVFGTEM